MVQYVAENPSNYGLIVVRLPLDRENVSGDIHPIYTGSSSAMKLVQNQRWASVN